MKVFSSAAIERGKLRKEIADMKETWNTVRRTEPREAAEILAAIAEKQAQYDLLGKRPSRHKMPG
jgi:hypothetical protein